MKLDFDVVIVGAGVAGMTAAIYLRRANINCCIIEKESPGGQINKTSTIENYPGIKEITGPELAMQMYNQIKDLEVVYKYGNVLEIKDEKNYKIVKTDIEEITCKGVILAIGRIPRKLNLPQEDELMGKGLSYCAICDGPLYKGLDVLVVGGGNSALEESLYLSEVCKKVTLIHRKAEFTAQQYLIDKVTKKKNIKILFETEVQDFLTKDDKLIAVNVLNKKTNKKKKIKVQGCFLYIGYVPNTASFSSLDILDEQGYIKTDATGRTKVPFIYGAGDVVFKDLYQIVTATSDGARAATSFIKDLER